MIYDPEANELERWRQEQTRIQQDEQRNNPKPVDEVWARCPKCNRPAIGDGSICFYCPRERP